MLLYHSVKIRKNFPAVMQLSVLFLVFAITILWKSAYDCDGTLLQHIQLGTYARRISQLLKNMVVTMLDNGFNVIVDEVCVGENSDMADWKSMLASYRVLYVGINTSVATLEQREKARGDRILGSARAQWQDVHKGAKYDVGINTDELCLADCVGRIIDKLDV